MSLIAALALGLSAAGATTLEHARELGAGSTSRADDGGITSVITAPATLGLVSRYDIFAGGTLGGDATRGLQVGAMDSTMGGLALGLVYHYQYSEPVTPTRYLPGWKRPGADLDNPLTSTVLGGAIAGAFERRTFGVGMNFMYHTRDSRFTGKEQAFGVGASVATHLGEQVIFSVTGENLIPQDYEYTPLRVGAGAGWSPSDFIGLRTDVVTDFSSLEDAVAVTFAVGGEVVPGEIVSIRFGYQRDGVLDRDLISFGLGVGADKIGIDYGGEVAVTGAEGAFFGRSWHGLTARFSL